MPSHINHFYRFGEFTIDADQVLLLSHGDPLLLAPKVLETLLTLVQNGGRIIEKEELMKRLWPDTCVEESNLTYCIVQLRKTLGDEARHPRYIETIPKRGYRFIVDVEEGVSDVAIESKNLPRRIETHLVESHDAASSTSERVASLAVLPFLDLSPDRDQDYFCEGLADELINTLASLPNLQVASRTSSFRFKSTRLDIREVAQQIGRAHV